MSPVDIHESLFLLVEVSFFFFSSHEVGSSSDLEHSIGTLT